jgi:VanZ family protein
VRQRLAWERLWHALGVLLVAFVSFMSLTPDPPDLGGPPGYKVGHVLAYLTLSLWYAQLVPRGRGRLVVVAGFSAMGVLFEYLQGMIETRGFEYSDMAINSAGALLGYALGQTPLDGALAWLERVVGAGRA